jgi:hypothetical protein
MLEELCLKYPQHEAAKLVGKVMQILVVASMVTDQHALCHFRRMWADQVWVKRFVQCLGTPTVNPHRCKDTFVQVQNGMSSVGVSFLAPQTAEKCAGAAGKHRKDWGAGGHRSGANFKGGR